MNPRSILITGASRGLGLEMVTLILRGPSPPEFLFAACRDPTKAEKLNSLAAAHSNLHIIKLDVINDSEIASAVETVATTLGDRGLNLLINNAGIAIPNGLQATTVEQLMENYRINTAAPFAITKAFLSLLQQGAKQIPAERMSCSRAAVIMMGSICGSLELHDGWANIYPYRLSKAALHMLTRCLSYELKNDGILTTTIHPGWVRTDMGTQDAPLSIEESIPGVLATLGMLNETHNGRLLNYKGEIMAW